ncbi:MAG: iron hydrogenase small subunit, partial [Oscillospiraceae bacterium]|nr:iron hydrogenase small subunit [Oscillospiraceae bacterium]
DHSASFKRAERNPVVMRMLEEMGEHKAHELLHVSYVKE